MFGFSIFNTSQWHRLTHSRLHGFIGFVFGTIIFAAPLIYISTSLLIIRNKKPLITIPLPKLPDCIKSKKTETPVIDPITETKSETKDETTEQNENIPPEIRAAFIRAKNHPLDIKIKPLNTQNTDNNSDISDTTLPLPTDFDIEPESQTDSETIPTFTDFNFDTNEPETTKSYITEYLNNKNIEFEIIDDIIVTKTHAIATHDDSDFWVVDNENWFATGKTKPSPITTIKTIASQHNVTPVLYLAETNIMDIETLIPQWESDGIQIITDIEAL